MKNIVILFADKSTKYMFEPVFNGKSAYDLALAWAKKTTDCAVYIFAYEKARKLLEENTTEKVSFVYKSEWNVRMLMEEVSLCIKAENAEAAVYAFADCPFLNRKLTKEILETHEEFVAEYTYSEGFPYGFSCEVVDGGTADILASLSKDIQKDAGEKEVTRNSFFDLLSTDINSFEIETVLSEDDYRLLRYSFDCGKKENFMACIALYNALEKDGKNKNLEELDAEDVSILASNNVDILKTVPGFYNIQISSVSDSNPIYIPHSAPVSKNGEFMQTEKIFNLIEQIAEFSENAVLCLSYFGDPLFHKDLSKIVEKILSYPGLSVFIETDYISEESADVLRNVALKAESRTNGYEKIMISINLDSFTSETYAKIRGKTEADFEKAVQGVKNAATCFPSSVYPQFIRMNENEEELESFFRYWNEKSNSSNGNFIIQKYNSFCGLIPDRKPADLSPVERNVCWHLRRDMNILVNGDVTFCHSCFNKVVGNVFTETLEKIWNQNNTEIMNHINKTYCDKCGKCDEYYTFNF